MEKPKATDRIIDKAVDIWCKKLYSPEFDNGDNSVSGVMCHSFALMNMEANKKSVSNMDDQVSTFRKHLSSKLKQQRDDDEYFAAWLDVDYYPCAILSEAAEAAKIPPSLFSIKSHVSIKCNHVAASFGYGAMTENHYPLPDGKWLVTDLSGNDDLALVINHVIHGNQIGLKVTDE